MSLSVLNPVQITDAMLVSSTALENDYAAYNPATAYTAAQRCISTVTHRIYECVTGCTGKDPTDINNRTGTPIYWSDVAPTNRWKMFDGESSSQTVIASPLTIVLHPGFFNAIYLGNLSAETIEVTVKDATGGNVIYHYLAALENSQPTDYYEHFFSPFRPQKDFIASGIDPYNAAELTITLTSPSPVACGLFAIGDLQPLGLTLRGVEIDPKTYSYINIDAFGNNQIVRRKSAKDMAVKALVDLTEADYVVDVLTELQDVPCLYVASDSVSHRSARTFGLGKGKLIYDLPTTCSLNLNVQGPP
jgi:hypothetical protein